MTDNAELARRAIEHFNRGEIEALGEMLAPDGEVVPLRAALEATVYRGPDALQQFWAAVQEEWESVAIVVDEIRDFGDRILVLGRLQGKARRSAVEVDTAAGWVARLRAGEITSIRTFADAGQAERVAARGEGEPA